jgi:hypothetical protein
MAAVQKCSLAYILTAISIGPVTACSEFDSGQVTCDGHKLDFRLSIRFMCKERGLS